MLRKLVPGFALALAAMLVFAGAAHAGDPGSITAQRAHELARAGEVLLIDVRRPEEWRETGIGGSARPVSMHERGFVEKLLALTGGDRSAPLALICAAGVRSGFLRAQLLQLGFTRVIDVSEGMLGSAAGAGWLKAGLPVKPYRK
ncbi:MAG: rhodanese-like domain-containing protein [Hyphomicrobiales bacterium]